MSTVQSYASGKMYLLAQMREYGDGIHFQLSGPEINRKYGFAFTTQGHSGASLLLEMAKKVQAVPSLANTGENYFPCQIRPYPEKLHVQAKGPAVNRDYGVAVNLNVSPEILETLRGLL